MTVFQRAPHGNIGILLGIGFAAAFTALIWTLSPLLADLPKHPDTGYEWYYWRTFAPTDMTRLLSWGPYLLHQVAIWGLIWFAQTRGARYTDKLQWFNVAALGANAAFSALHLLQTHTVYAGLADDASIFLSQGSVILLLVMVLILENERRGVFFGKRFPFGATARETVKRYHGYVFSWAAIFTFWYHPMEGTQGHLIGFFYMFLLMAQSSLFFNRAHLNRLWTGFLEVLVLFHGTLVAVQQGGQLWAMFLFGFGFIFIATQMHGLGWPRWALWATFALFVVSATLYYGLNDLRRADEIVRIPAIEYALAILLAGLIALVGLIARGVRRLAGAGAPAAAR